MDLTFFYPQSQQTLFTDRDYHLEPLDLTQQALLDGCGQHLAFLYARERGLAFSSQQDLQTLGELLGVRFAK